MGPRAKSFDILPPLFWWLTAGVLVPFKLCVTESNLSRSSQMATCTEQCWGLSTKTLFKVYSDVLAFVIPFAQFAFL
jgi:hypothetical protein